MNEQKIEMVREQITSCDSIYIVEKGDGTRTPTYFIHFALSRYEGPEKVLLELWRKPELAEVDATPMNFTKKSFDEAWLEDGNFVLKTDKGVEIELALRSSSGLWMRADANWVPYTMLETPPPPPPELAMLSPNLSKLETLGQSETVKLGKNHIPPAELADMVRKLDTKDVNVPELFYGTLSLIAMNLEAGAIRYPKSFVEDLMELRNQHKKAVDTKP